MSELLGWKKSKCVREIYSINLHDHLNFVLICFFYFRQRKGNEERQQRKVWNREDKAPEELVKYVSEYLCLSYLSYLMWKCDESKPCRTNNISPIDMLGSVYLDAVLNRARQLGRVIILTRRRGSCPPKPDWREMRINRQRGYSTHSRALVCLLSI